MGVFDVSTPAGTDPISQGDDRIREVKVAVLEMMRAGAADGVEAVAPGPAPLTAPIFRPRGGRGSTAARPAAAVGGLYSNTDTGTIQRSNGTTWDEATENAAFEAIHHKVAQALASVAGVVTLPETANSFNVTGTEAVTSIAGWSAGIVIVKWASDRILTHGASLVVQGAVSRNLTAGDISVFEFTGADAVREVGFHGAGSGVETGVSVMYNGTAAPSGFLEENGASLLRASYPRLFARIGTQHGTADGTHFNVPDSRGFFVRGFDNGAGNDPNAAARTAAKSGGATGDSVGAAQAEDYKAHTHGMGTANTAVGGGGVGVAQLPAADSSFTTNSPTSGGSETRPKNISKMFCIKY